MGGRFLRIAIASAPRVKRMAAVIVRRLCRQRRSQLRKQLRHSPPLYQSTRPSRQVKSTHCVVKGLHFIGLNQPNWGHHRTNTTGKGSSMHGMLHYGSESCSFREVSQFGPNGGHICRLQIKHYPRNHCFPASLLRLHQALREGLLGFGQQGPAIQGEVESRFLTMVARPE